MKLVHKAAATAVVGFVTVAAISLITLDKAESSLHHMRADAVSSAAVGAARGDVIASTICLQCQHSMLPGPYTVRKNSRSRVGVQAQCCFVPATVIGETLAEIAEIGASRRSPETVMVPGRRPEFQPPRFRRAAYVPK